MERVRFPYAGTQIVIHDGDISQVPSDAMITAINSGGMWFGGIDGVIQRAAGTGFHQQASAAMPLKDGQTVVAKKRAAHRGAWGDVVFVIDDLQQPLNKIVRGALTAAGDAGYRTVSLPAIRTGVMLGAVEKNAQQAVAEIILGFRSYLDETPGTSIKEIRRVQEFNAPLVAFWAR